MIVAMPWLDDAGWDEHKHALTVVDEQAEQIRFAPLHRHSCSKLEFARGLPQLLPRISALVAESDFVHSQFSYDLYRPAGFAS